MTTGTGSLSLRAAMQEEFSPINGVSDLCVVSTSRPEDRDGVGEGRHSHSEGMTEWELARAISRAELAMTDAYRQAVAAVESDLWELAAYHADRGRKHLDQLIALVAIQPKEKA